MTAATTAVPVEELARRLTSAREQRRTVPQLVHEHPDLDFPTAYAIQQAGFAQRLAAGETLIGYKIGLGSRSRQRAMGVDEPIYGRLSSAMLHSEDEPLGDALVHPRIEPELAFLLGDDVDGRCPTVATVLAATAGLAPAFEILDSRYDDFSFTQPDAVADNASVGRIVVGGRLLAPDSLDPQLEGVVLRVDGEVVGSGAGAIVGGHPALPLTWLAAAVGGLKAGQIVLSGALTPAVQAQGARSVAAEYTNLGRLVLRIA